MQIIHGRHFNYDHSSSTETLGGRMVSNHPQTMSTPNCLPTKTLSNINKGQKHSRRCTHVSVSKGRQTNSKEFQETISAVARSHHSVARCGWTASTSPHLHTSTLDLTKPQHSVTISRCKCTIQSGEDVTFVFWTIGLHANVLQASAELLAS